MRSRSLSCSLFVHVALASASLTPALRSAAGEPAYAGKSECVWWEVAGDYRGYSLRLGPAPPGSTVTAEFDLIQHGVIAGRFPLRQIETTSRDFPVKFSVACLSRPTRDESVILVTVRAPGPPEETTQYRFRLQDAIEERALPEQKRQPQPDGPANGSQPIRAGTNTTSSAAGSRR
jgi:hypothetical protein